MADILYYRSAVNFNSSALNNNQNKKFTRKTKEREEFISKGAYKLTKINKYIKQKQAEDFLKVYGIMP